MNNKVKKILLDQTCSTCQFWNIDKVCAFQLSEGKLKDEYDSCEKWKEYIPSAEWPIQKPVDTIYYIKPIYTEKE